MSLSNNSDINLNTENHYCSRSVETLPPSSVPALNEQWQYVVRIVGRETALFCVCVCVCERARAAGSLPTQCYMTFRSKKYIVVPLHCCGLALHCCEALLFVVSL